jgi:hypothetical protein
MILVNIPHILDDWLRFVSKGSCGTFDGRLKGGRCPSSSRAERAADAPRELKGIISTGMPGLSAGCCLPRAEPSLSEFGKRIERTRWRGKEE